ncbi:histidinol dehydrogenase [Parvularcula flava]|nr:histidinol dehydrogenase [Aquisalinus luteolus]NHK29225.1 histidinol dehydrogenase [Aquisalinus luteolus]
MARRLNQGDVTFEERFAELLTVKRESSVDVNDQVAQIISDVRKDGDEALFIYTKKFDRFELSTDNLTIGKDEVDAAVEACSPEDIKALELAASRIAAYHERQKPEDVRYTDDQGVTLGWRWTAVDAAGLYVPGGTASYPSSVLMNAIPARVAGVERVVMVVPTPDDKINPLVLAAARLAGIDEIYRIGGAQAIAALAYGTASIAPVDKIVGPGNAYVAAAKKQVFGQVGIDSIAGPSEILVIADSDNDPDWIAADLLSQAEHDTSSQSVLITDNEEFADAVAIMVEKQLGSSPRQEIASEAWQNNSAIIVVDDLTEACALSNRLAPEHLELAIADPDRLIPHIRHAGAIFLGRYAPEAIGDYLAGPDHVLPTARAARYASGLSVLDFMKRTSIIGAGEDALRQIGPAAVTLANAEGLHSHAKSVALRLKPKQ